MNFYTKRVSSILILFCSFSMMLQAQKECVIIIQGFELKSEHFASNSSDAAVTAFNNYPKGAKVTRLAPKKTNRSDKVKPENLYNSKEDLLQKLKEALCDKDCDDVVLNFIGHGMGGIGGLYSNPKKGEAGGMLVDEIEITEDETRNIFITSDDIAKLIDECKKEVKLLDIHCYAEHMIDGILRAVQNKNLVKIAIGSSKDNEKSWFDQEDNLSEEEKKKQQAIKDKYKKAKDAAAKKGDKNEVERLNKAEKKELDEMETEVKTKQFYEFLRAFLADYYRIIMDPNVMREIEDKAKKLHEKAKKDNQTKEKKRNEIRKNIQIEKDRLNDCLKHPIIKKVKRAEDEVAVLDSLLKLFDKLIALKKQDEILKDKYNNAKGKTKNALKKQRSQLKKEMVKITQVLRKNKIKVHAHNKLADMQAKRNWLEKRKKNGKEKLDKLNTQADKHLKPCLEFQKKIKGLEDQLAAIKDNSKFPPIMELVLHESFKSGKTGTKTSTAVEKESPVSKVNDIQLPKKKVILVGVAENDGNKRLGQYKYYLNFYKVIDEKTKKCVVVGYVSDYLGNPYAPLKTVACDTSCSVMKAKFKVDGKEKTVALKKNKKGAYEATIDGKSQKSKQMAMNTRIIPASGRGERVSVYADMNGTTLISYGNNNIIQGDKNGNQVDFSIEEEHFSFAYLDHGNMAITQNGSTQYSDDFVFVSLYNDEGLRIGEASISIANEQASGRLWMEYSNKTYELSGTYNSYNEFYDVAANTDAGMVRILKNDWNGLLESYWKKEGSTQEFPAQVKDAFLPFVFDLAVTTNHGNTGKKPQLSWSLNTDYLTEKSNVSQ